MKTFSSKYLNICLTVSLQLSNWLQGKTIQKRSYTFTNKQKKICILKVLIRKKGPSLWPLWFFKWHAFNPEKDMPFKS